MEDIRRIVRVKSSNGNGFGCYKKVIINKVMDISLLYVGFGMTKIYAKNVIYNLNTDWVRVVMLNTEEIKINKNSLNMVISKQLYRVDFDDETEWFVIDSNMDYTTEFNEEDSHTLDNIVCCMTWKQMMKSTL